MDPLTVGFEEALYDANRGVVDRAAIDRLVAALQRIVDASPHRTGGAVTVTVLGGGGVELRRPGGGTLVLERTTSGWRIVGADGPAYSGPTAAAITAWLTG